MGKLDASLALLLTNDHHLIEFPSVLLPHGVKAGSVVKIKCERDIETEVEKQRQFQAIQDEIIETFGKNLPQTPKLSVKNVTQTSIVLQWDKLDLGTASLKNLVLFRDGSKAGAIPQPLTNQTTKLSGLPIDKTFKFHLRLDTTAGVFTSNEVEVTTHKMTDLSGITVCLGDITPNDQFTVDDIEAALKNMGAHYPPQDKVRVDTTHFITTRENKQNPEFIKANEMNIPIIRPEWLKACERERRIIGVRDFYVKDCALPQIFAANYWQAKPKSSDVSRSASLASGAPDAPAVQVTSPSPNGEATAEANVPEDKAEAVPEANGEPISDGAAKAVETTTGAAETSETPEKSDTSEQPEAENVVPTETSTPTEDPAGGSLEDQAEKPEVPEKSENSAEKSPEESEKPEPVEASTPTKPADVPLEEPAKNSEVPEESGSEEKPQEDPQDGSEKSQDKSSEEKPEVPEKSKAPEVPEKPTDSLEDSGDGTQEKETSPADGEPQEDANEDGEDGEDGEEESQQPSAGKSQGSKKANKKKKNKKRK